jgi:hypothetical protein
MHTHICTLVHKLTKKEGEGGNERGSRVCVCERESERERARER